MFLHKDRDLFKDEKDYMNVSLFKRFIIRFIEQRLLGSLGELELLIFRAREFGLSEIYVKDALDNIEYNESQLACESLLEQIYEFDIKINKEFYDLAMKNCDNLKIDKSNFHFLLELIEENQPSSK